MVLQSWSPYFNFGEAIRFLEMGDFKFTISTGLVAVLKTGGGWGVMALALKLKLKFIWLSSHQRTMHQLTPGFCGAQVRYIFTHYPCILNTHILLKIFKQLT
jgi:hypothetical protein